MTNRKNFFFLVLESTKIILPISDFLSCGLSVGSFSFSPPIVASKPSDPLKLKIFILPALRFSPQLSDLKKFSKLNFQN